jgi:trk system potassium uptake protein TrkH
MRSKISLDKVQLFGYFIGLSLIGALALSMPCMYVSGLRPPFVDALFTSVSAVCVTGLSTLSMSVYTKAGFVAILALIELGGLGIVTFFSFYIAVPQKKVSLVNRSVIRDFFIDDVESEPKRIIRSIVVFTAIIQLFAAIPLYIGFSRAGSPFPALNAAFHSVSAFCNAGFSTYDDSLGGFSGEPLILVPILVLFVLGGLGFIVLTDIFRFATRARSSLSLHSKIVLSVTGALLISGASVLFALERDGAFAGLGSGNAALVAFFQSATPRTAGFTVVPQASFAPFSRLIISVLMFIGGSPGSIAGGVKTTTFFLVVLYALRGNSDMRGLNLARRNLDTPLIEKAFSIVAKSIIVVVVAVAALFITEVGSLARGVFSEFALVFETISAFSTVGLSQGITASLTDPGKVIIILTMFIGRTGIFAMALGFSKSEKERFVEYPSARVMVG